MNVHSGRLEKVLSRIENACTSAGRDSSDITLVAVSKLHSASAIIELYQQGQVCFGENRLQEAIAKQAEVGEPNIIWHFIGPIQSNKTREIAGHFNWVQSVDRARILDRLASQRPDAMGDLNICLQVNIDREPQKAGIAPEEVMQLAEQARRAKGIRLRGLMCIPKLGGPDGDTRDSFARMRKLYDELNTVGYELDTLSMGMSSDFESAIAEGSTMVRVGTDLFGPRPSSGAGRH